MNHGSFLAGLIAGAASAGALAFLLTGRGLGAVDSLEVSPVGLALTETGPVSELVGATSRMSTSAAPRISAPTPAHEQAVLAPPEAATRLEWDPVEAYFDLVREPLPEPFPWMHIARGLEAVEREDLAAEAWWAALRRDPQLPGALSSLERLEPGGVAQRMELELRTYLLFDERLAMEAHLVPIWIESGRSAAGAECVDLDRLLRFMQRPDAQPQRVHRLHLLCAARPLEAEVAFEYLLKRPGLVHTDRSILEGLLRTLRGPAGSSPEPAEEAEGFVWTVAERDELLTTDDVDANIYVEILATLPESIDLFRARADATIQDVVRSEDDRASDLYELALVFAREGERDYALGLIQAALEITPDALLLELQRHLELGRPAGSF